MKIIQYGEGNFLRAFVDLYLDTLNKEGLGNFDVSIIKPIARGSLEKFYQQNCKYNVVLRGKHNGKDVEDVYHVDCVSEVLNPFLDNEQYYLLASDPEVKILISNTTEAGICFDENDRFDQCPNISYPAKVTKWLYKRFKAGLDGIYLLPVELIDNNADELYRCVDKYIKLWGLEEEFKIWNDTQNYYCNTLVDRIVSGYPRDEITKNRINELIKEEDLLVTIGEPFGLWVIQNKGEISSILKDGHHNIDVVFTDDISYYKKRKVRVLNGSHTNLVPISLWLGKETVYDVMTDTSLSAFVDNSLKFDINPFVSDNIDMTSKFADEVKERFLNPFLGHQLTSIALNSISKWKARVLPSFNDYYSKNNSIPTYLTIGFAYLVTLYMNIKKSEEGYVCLLPSREIEFRDEVIYLEYFLNGKSLHDFMSDISIWGVDLTTYNGFENKVSVLLEEIKQGKELI